MLVSLAPVTVPCAERAAAPARLASRVFSVCEQADVICDYRSLFQTSSSGLDGTTVHVSSYTGSPNVLRAADAAAARVR